MADALALLNWEENGLVTVQQKLANFVQQLQMTLPMNSVGLYTQYIDPTVIAECVPYATTTDDIPDDKLQSAIVQMDIEDGMVCVNGLPIWDRLDGEPIQYYKVFKEYRDMKYNLPTQDTNNNTNNNTNKVKIPGFNDNNNNSNNPRTVNLYGTRSIARLSELLSVPGRLLTILSKIYHWQMRVKAFDIQQTNEFALKRQREAEMLESKHAKYSMDILEQAVRYLAEHPQQLNPKVAIQMVEIGMKYGRISSGLLGDKPGSQASAVHQTNIAISQSNTTNQADQMLNVSMGDDRGDTQGQGSNVSPVERQYKEQIKDPNQLMSILHVLNKSNAFKAAATGNKSGAPDEEVNDIEDDTTGQNADTYVDADTNTSSSGNVAAVYDIKDAAVEARR